MLLRTSMLFATLFFNKCEPYPTDSKVHSSINLVFEKFLYYVIVKTLRPQLQWMKWTKSVVNIRINNKIILYSYEYIIVLNS